MRFAAWTNVVFAISRVSLSVGSLPCSTCFLSLALMAVANASAAMAVNTGTNATPIARTMVLSNNASASRHAAELRSVGFSVEQSIAIASFHFKSAIHSLHSPVICESSDLLPLQRLPRVRVFVEVAVAVAVGRAVGVEVE